MGVPSLNVSCAFTDVIRRWHVTTQELLFRHLRAIWRDDRPRVMADLGSHAGHGLGRNVSDALLWLDYFHSDGSAVLGVDAFEDFALDLQHRFDSSEPYASMLNVSKISVHGAIQSIKPGVRYHPCAGNGSKCTELGRMAAFTYLMCTRTDWFNDYERMDRHSDSDHVCRITRQRAGVSASHLTMPPSAHGYTFSTAELQRTNGSIIGSSSSSDGRKLIRHDVPIVTVDDLVQRYLPDRRIDFLKVDMDEKCASHALAT